MQWRGSPIAGNPNATSDKDTVWGSRAKAGLWKAPECTSGTSLDWCATR